MHHNLCVFCTFSAFAQNIFKGLGCNFTRSFGQVMRSKSMKMVFVASVINHQLCMIYAFFYFFFQKSFFTKKNFLPADINLTIGFYCILVLLYSYNWDLLLEQNMENQKHHLMVMISCIFFNFSPWSSYWNRDEH